MTKEPLHGVADSGSYRLSLDNDIEMSGMVDVFSWPETRSESG